MMYRNHGDPSNLLRCTSKQYAFQERLLKRMRNATERLNCGQNFQAVNQWKRYCRWSCELLRKDRVFAVGNTGWAINKLRKAVEQREVEQLATRSNSGIRVTQPSAVVAVEISNKTNFSTGIVA